jgi:hypothetical protein
MSLNLNSIRSSSVLAPLWSAGGRVTSSAAWRSGIGSLLLAILLAAPAAANITGTVFRDVNGNGVNNGGIEAGVGGVSVQAFNAISPTAVASTTTAANGTYTLTLGAGNYRVEFVIPFAINHFQPGPSLSGSGTTSVVFAANGAVVNFAVINPGQFCQAAPLLGVNCYLNGPQPPYSNAGEDVLVSFPYTAGCADEDQNGACDAGSADNPTPTELARGSELGTTWGLAFQRSTDTMFATSFQKRHSGFRTYGDTGVIYRVNNASQGVAATVAPYVDFDALGIPTANTAAFPPDGDPHPAPTLTCTSALGTADPGSTNRNCWLHDPGSYGQVGKMSFGDLDISDDESTLWTVNLFNRTLYSIPVKTTPVVLGDIGAFPLPTPACAGVIRPFAVGIEDGLVYVGMVCDASAGTAANLQAYVYSFDPDNVPGGFTQRLSAPLNYTRGFVVNSGGANIPAAWRPWSDDPATVSGPVFGTERGNPQPWITDIEFDDDDLVLGIRDRFADQSGFDLGTPNNASNTVWRGDGAGDTLRACPSGSNWVFESNANCGGITTGGAGNGDGPGGGEYYFEERLTTIHDETSLGGLFQVPINSRVVSTVYDPLNNSGGTQVFSGGIHWWRRSDGQVDNLYRVFLRSDPNTFGKAGGLGDLEALCSPAPLEIGNRVWLDADRDGLQDPGESGFNGATVLLFENPDGVCNGVDEVQVGSVVTPASGNYLFTNANVTGGIKYRTNYCLRIVIPAGFGPTLLDATPVGDGQDDIRDSDGNPAPFPGSVVTTFTTGSPGFNRHIYDFGFRALEFDWADLPDGPYPTLAASNGPNHEITSPGNCFLGGAPDSEVNGQPNATATGDDNDINGDDEDGVTFLTPLNPGNVADIQVTSSAACVLNAWIDFNTDGDFTDPGEQIATNLALAAGANLLNNIPVPANATGIMGARFRVTNLAGQGGGSPTGPATTGEVEDYRVAALGDRVWEDSNGDGLQTAGEPGVAGVVVNLLDCANNPVLDGNGAAISTITDVAGNYAFPGLPVGCYRARFVAPAGTGFTTQDVGGDDTIDSDPNPTTGITADVNLAQGTSNPTVDAGLVPATGAIGNYVWVDENSDGLQDAGEPGIPNVAVELSVDTTGNGQPDTVVATTVTDAAGGYLFSGLLPGLYFVDVFDGTDATPNTLPAGLTQTTPSTNPNSDFGNQNHSGDGYSVTLGVGGENLTADFGYNYNPTPDVNGNTGTAAIGDRVWLDANGDGVQDPNELGLAGVTVNLLCAGPDGEFGTGDDVAASTTTDATGNYLFDGLTPSACTVTVVPPGGYTQTGDPDDFGMPAGSPDNTTTNPVILGPGDVFLNADFGYQPPAAQNNSVGDTVWNDLDGDGIQDGGEPGIPGVTVKLALDVDGDGIFEPFGNDGIPGNADDEPILATDTTDASGIYGFDGVPDGNYVVCITDSANVLSGLQNTGDPDDDGVPGNGDEDGAGAVDLDSLGASAVGVNNPDQDFGYTDPQQNPGDGAIGDTVFLDSNANNAPDAGEGIEGVVVKLLLDPDGIPNNGDEILVATDTTDENGNYFFGGLDPAATYTVMVDTTTLPPGLANTFDPDGGNDDMSSTDLSVNGPIDLTQDFGYQPAGGQTVGSIGNLVWLDANADGVNDGPNGPDGLPGTDDDEPGLAGKTLDLYYDANGNGLVDPGEPRLASTVTNGSGNYLFANLPTDDGSGSYDYVVDVTDTADMLAGYWHSLGNQSQAVDDTSKSDTYGVTLTPGTPNVTTVDFGYYVDLAALGNRVWIDANFNGLQDPAELSGIAGVEVTLTITYPGGTMVSVQTTTDANGFYQFANLLADEDYNGDGVAPEPTFVISIDLADPDNVAALAGVGPPTMIDVNNPADDFRDADDPAGVAAFATQGITDMTVDAGTPANEAAPEGSYDFGFRALEFDWGDLPDGPYATLAVSNGPNHEVTSPGNCFLGGAPDTEVNGQPNATATGDDNDINGDDEDGVTFLTPLDPGNVADIQVTSSGACVLNAWIDFNSDGDFTDPGEQVASNLALAAGVNLLDNVPVPANATGIMAARFRVTNLAGQGGGSPTGAATTGEVEDYVLASLGNFVWNDSVVGMGIQVGGDTPVSGVLVELLAPNGVTAIVDGAGTPITATTDVNGNYEFPGLPPGSYRVRFGLPAPFVDFSPRDNTTDDLDSDADQITSPTPGLSQTVALAVGVTNVDLDAGLRAVTVALITSAAAYDDGGSVVFEFSTGYEALSSGFEVYRFDESLGDYVAVSEAMVTALLGSPQGGVYRVVDEHAPFSETLRYVVVEHQADGGTQTYGPFPVALEARGDRAAFDGASAALPHVSQRMVERLTAARAERPASPGKGASKGTSLVSGAGNSSGFADPGVTVHTLQVDVADSGLYFVSSAEIAATLSLPVAAVREAVGRHNVVVENQGRAIAWLAPRGSEEGVYFYGEAIESLYTARNTYWLKVNAPGVPMEELTGSEPTASPGGVFTSTERFEEDVIPSINGTRETEADFWFWEGINAGSSNTIRTFELAIPDVRSGKATLTARFAGVSNGPATDDHHAIVRVNGVEVGTAVWSGLERHEARMVFDASLLTAETTLEVEGTLAGGSTASLFFIDGFAVEYPRAYRAVGDSLMVTGDGNPVITVEGFSSRDVAVFDLSDPALPRILENVRVEVGAGGYQASFEPDSANTPYLVATLSVAQAGSHARPQVAGLDVTAGHHRYAHVVIAPEAWRTEAEALAAYHSQHGLRSVAVSIEEIYDAFSYGNVTPWAIRDFLAYARDNWVQGPDYVVLAGRGTFDPRNLMGDGDSFIPVVLVGTPHGLVSSDNVLADLSGGDAIPEVAIGRLPIVSAGELAAYAEKLAAYDGAGGAWRGRALLVADNPDPAGDFSSQSDAVAALLGGYSQQSVYLGEMDIDSARAALEAAWNDGAQLVNYVGHGGVMQFAAEGLLRASDMGLLANGERLPVVSALTCVIGRSDIPSVESLAEALVTDADGGAIAVWAPSGLSQSGAAHELNVLYAGILQAAGEDTPLGDLVMQTLDAFGAAGGSVEMLNTYSITGDPAVQIP